MDTTASLPAETLRIMLALFPEASKQRQELISAQRRMVHYTSAFVGINMIRRREVWMRKPQWMSDYTEIQHGFDCIAHMYHNGPGGKAYKDALEAVVPGIVERAIKNFDQWLPAYRRNTFVTCVSTHDADEDATGRMGMWNAYAKSDGVAMVLRPEPFTAISDVLGAFSYPVSYRNKEEVDTHFGQVAANIPAVADILKAMPVERLEWLLHELFKYEMLCTKRHAFKDEREWRIIFTPDRLTSGQPYLITKDVEFVNGAPQPVCKIPLDKHPDYDISIPTILERVIVGPSKFADAVIESFVIELEKAGVPDAAKKVFFADVPIRT